MDWLIIVCILCIILCIVIAYLSYKQTKYFIDVILSSSIHAHYFNSITQNRANNLSANSFRHPPGSYILTDEEEAEIEKTNGGNYE